MKIVVFGANGKTGLNIVKQALEKGYTVVGFVRKPGSFTIDHPNLKIAVGNLDEKLKMADIISGADACISALGGNSLQKRAPEFTNGISNIVDIMEQEKVNRLIYISSIGAGESRYMIPQPMRFFITRFLLKVPLADHNTNEEKIRHSNLQWTIVRPASLMDGPIAKPIKSGTEIVKLKGNPLITRANVATFILNQLEEKTYENKNVWIYE